MKDAKAKARPDPSASSAQAHRDAAPKAVRVHVITVSDSRTLETDTGGALVAEMLAAKGHLVPTREIVRDEPAAIQAALRAALSQEGIDAVILTGGTGIAPRDLTPESVQPLLERILPGFGELFRMLSFEEIGAAALLSRALAGLARGRVVFALPGSRAAVRLALERLILPELGHLTAEAVKQR